MTNKQDFYRELTVYHSCAVGCALKFCICRKTYYRTAARCAKAPQKFRLLEKIYQMLPLDMKYLVVSYSLDQFPKLDHRGIERDLTYVVKIRSQTS